MSTVDSMSVTQGATVLVVDDSRTERAYASELLQSEGFTVLEADNGALAITIIKERVPDAVLLDILMPEKDGFDVLKSLLTDSSITQVPIIMVTALEETVYLKYALDHGAVDYIRKPIDRLELLSRLRTAIRIKQQETTLAQNNMKLKSDVRLARELQKRITVPEVITNPRYTLYSRYIPCDELAGDYLNIIERDDTVFLVSADVAGHGLAASFYTFMLDIALRSIIETERDPLEIIQRLARDLKRILFDGTFISVNVIAIDLVTRTLETVFAGHPPFIIRGKKESRLIQRRSIFITSLCEDEGWQKDAYQLEEGDSIILFTDGLFEVPAKDGELLGYEGVYAFVREVSVKSPEELLNRIVYHVKRTSKADDLEDDISLCVFSPAPSV